MTGRKCSTALWEGEQARAGSRTQALCLVGLSVQLGVDSEASAMKTKNVNLLFAFVAILLFGFSCFCISKMNQTSKRGWGGVGWDRVGWSGVTVGDKGDGDACHPASREPHHQRAALWL